MALFKEIVNVLSFKREFITQNGEDFLVFGLRKVASTFINKAICDDKTNS